MTIPEEYNTDLTISQLDDVDKEILKELQKDSRIQYRDLAKKVRKSLGTVSNRINKLVDFGVIKNWTINVNPEIVGIDLTTIINISIDVRYLEEINGELSMISELIAIYNVTGQFDIVAIGRFYNRRHLDKIIHKIIKIPNIRSTSSTICLRTLKEDLYLDFPTE